MSCVQALTVKTHLSVLIESFHIIFVDVLDPASLPPKGITNRRTVHDRLCRFRAENRAPQ